MSAISKRLKRWLGWGGLLVLLLSLIASDQAPAHTPRTDLQLRSTPYAFNFVTWELEATLNKLLYGLLAPQRFMDDEMRAHFVLAYLDSVAASQALDRAITAAYVNPEIADPDAETRALQAELAALRARLARESPIAEAILEEQLTQILREGGFGVLGQLFPPLSGTFTPLPQLLIISPRDHIERSYQRALLPGLTAAQQEALEAALEAQDPTISAYVTNIGGLSAYPAMLRESSALDWVAEVMAHEWAHHYLMGYPLGWYYDRAPETRTINETSASLLGEWAGQEAVLTFYRPLLARTKALPNPLIRPEEDTTTARFDFRAEMHHTRIIVDALLDAGQIEKAEAYMELQRRYFVSQGYRIRRLNQAYFAFHGAYASQPGGASGRDEVGPAVRRLWGLLETPQEFLRTIAAFTTLDAVRAAEETLAP